MTLDSEIENAISNHIAERDQDLLQLLAGHTVVLANVIKSATEDIHDTNALLDQYPELFESVPATTVKKMLDKWAAEYVRIAEGLTSIDPSFSGVLKGSRGLVGTDDYLRERVAFELSSRMIPNLESAADRCLEIAHLSLAIDPPSAVTGYLKRLSRCYLAHFDAECVILCRAILESSLRDRLVRGDAQLPKGMSQRLQLARKLGWLTREDEKSAMTVWQRGNKAVHEDPDLVKDVLGTIELTLQVASKLHRS